ncbi:hypothetical protein PR048_014491 [Dryococelus australis]|uniref:Uncharacterized protein n=1 Tax=Dryococelus australis TaxID=614101 RepID=A0ABQ9HEI7_9NEOP|nr:hypothetical protein PR048_014491 [Dryococelus australis]
MRACDREMRRGWSRADFKGGRSGRYVRKPTGKLQNPPHFPHVKILVIPPGDLARFALSLVYETPTELGATVAERSAPRSPPTKANRVHSPAGSPDFRKWESCRTMPLIVGLSRGLPFPPSLHSGAAPYSLQSSSSALKTLLEAVADVTATKHSSTRGVHVWRGKCVATPAHWTSGSRAASFCCAHINDSTASPEQKLTASEATFEHALNATSRRVHTRRWTRTQCSRRVVREHGAACCHPGVTTWQTCVTSAPASLNQAACIKPAPASLSQACPSKLASSLPRLACAKPAHVEAACHAFSKPKYLLRRSTRSKRAAPRADSCSSAESKSVTTGGRQRCRLDMTAEIFSANGGESRWNFEQLRNEWYRLFTVHFKSAHFIERVYAEGNPRGQRQCFSRAATPGFASAGEEAWLAAAKREQLPSLFDTNILASADWPRVGVTVPSMWVCPFSDWLRAALRTSLACDWPLIGSERFPIGCRLPAAGWLDGLHSPIRPTSRDLLGLPWCSGLTTRLPTKRTGLDCMRGGSRIFALRIVQDLVDGFSRRSPVSPALSIRRLLVLVALHPRRTSPSSALKTSVLKSRCEAGRQGVLAVLPAMTLTSTLGHALLAATRPVGTTLLQPASCAPACCLRGLSGRGPVTEYLTFLL